MKYLVLFSMISMGCATTKLIEIHLNNSGKSDGGVLRAAQDNEVEPFLKNYCGQNEIKIIDQKLKDEDLGGIIIHRFYRYKFVEFRCEK